MRSLLADDGRSVLRRPYTERRELLEGLALSGPSWQTPAYHRGDGAALLALSRDQGLEGIVAKRLDSAYEPGGRPGTWVKLKNHHEQELVIGGYLPGQGARSGRVGALLVGYFDRTAAERLRIDLQLLLPNNRAGSASSGIFRTWPCCPSRG